MNKLLHLFGGVLILAVIMYGVLLLFSIKTYDVEYGISFNQNHATGLGLDWRDTYKSMLEDIGPKYVRVAAMWNDVERERYAYTFDDVDYMMDMAEAFGTKVQLVVGQKAPRWPECHVPEFIIGEYNTSESEKHLFGYIEAVVERYKDHPALELWQVENEPYISFQFGECEGFRKDLVTAEVDLVRSLDPDHKIIITDSGELSTWRKPAKLGDILGTTMYRTVQTPKGMTIKYDFLPAAFYKLKARLLGKSYEEFFVAELQAEPWFTDSNPSNTDILIQQELFSTERMQENITYASRVGASRVYLWGVEWWYFMQEMHGVSDYVDVAVLTVNNSNN